MQTIGGKRHKSKLFRMRWYYPKITGYTWPDKVEVKWMENFLHWIKGESQTDMQGNPLPPEATTITIRI